MLNCEEASALNSRSLDQKLSLSQRMSLRFHLLMCHQCRRYLKQITLIKAASKKFNQHIEDTSSKLSDEARQRIRDKLEHH